MWASVDTCHRSQVWSQALPAACRAGLPKGLQTTGSVDVGKLANTEGRRKDRTSLLPGGLTLRPVSFFPSSISALVA